MKAPYCWLLLLAACTGTSQGTTVTSTTLPSCPVCPQHECKEANSPEQPYPARPQVASSPVAPDWHCFNMPRRKSGDVGLCWTNAEGCEEMRQFVEKEAKTPSACTTRPTAYCFGITYNTSWDMYCTLTSDGCEEAREALRKNPPAEQRKLGTCRLTRNSHPLDAVDASAATSEQ